MNVVPVVISTWKHGVAANAAAWKILSEGGSSLDAVETGARVAEADPEVINVGYGGLPDAAGKVTLDAAIMRSDGRAGAVAFLEHIKHPVSVARLVMETTDHVLLAGEGALEFALQNGFEKDNLLTDSSRKRWLRWREDMEQEPDRLGILEETHDTIGMVALDRNRDLAAACTTSGVAWKKRGRVGDSPIIGAGLYVDNEVGGAVGTGRGEIVLQMVGSFFVVQKIALGLHPQEACEAAIQRILKMRESGQIRNPSGPTFQVGFIAVNKSGECGSASLKPGFQYALCRNHRNQLIESRHFID